MPPVIQVENLSKLYRLGEVSTGTLSHDLNRWWHSVRGKDDPYLKIGQVNDRTKKVEKSKGGKNESGSAGSSEYTPTPDNRPQTSSLSDYVYALKDINFSVNQGEVLGIIGRNGAGKSTLLKILSRVTAPSSGRIKVKGRIASLLEVGTGFHPELTGRENIYLNGAILGMRRHEITSRLDEIVDFSGCAAYLDTPVKRYSSGMYVRLAFAVAAHLDSDILIVDEVLAVGDAHFQKKCFGRIKTLSSNSGRTVLFVSHSLSMVSALCDVGILLDCGIIYTSGPARDCVATYHDIEKEKLEVRNITNNGMAGSEWVSLVGVQLLDAQGKANRNFDLTEPIRCEITYKILESTETIGDPYVQISIHTALGEQVLTAMMPNPIVPHHTIGTYVAVCIIPGYFLNTGNYEVTIAMASTSKSVLVHFNEECVECFDVNENIEDELSVSRNGYAGVIPGLLRPRFEWFVTSQKQTPKSLEKTAPTNLL